MKNRILKVCMKIYLKAWIRCTRLHFLKKGSVYMHNTYMYIWNWDVELSHLPMVKVLLHFSHVSFKTFKERSLWIHQKMSGNLNTSRHWLMWNYKENILKWFKFNSFMFHSLIQKIKDPKERIFCKTSHMKLKMNPICSSYEISCWKYFVLNTGQRLQTTNPKHAKTQHW